MMKNNKVFQIFTIMVYIILVSCHQNKKDFDATGSFEAIETIISSEANGILLSFTIEEGQILKEGDIVGFVDSAQLVLKKKQLTAQLKTVGAKMPDAGELTQYFDDQLKVTRVQLNSLLKEQIRFESLVKSNGATTKQLDDINAQVEVATQQMEVIKAQKKAQLSNISTQTSGLNSEKPVLMAQIAQVDDQLKKCRIINPVKGTVLLKYAEKNEMTGQGKPLYKIADLSNMILRAYISGNQLPAVKLNQSVRVLTDDGEGGYIEKPGVIVWISEKSEFTPKTIQTKEERANKVYAIKIKVVNDGSLKIGMYGEVKWQ